MNWRYISGDDGSVLQYWRGCSLEEATANPDLSEWRYGDIWQPMSKRNDNGNADGYVYRTRAQPRPWRLGDRGTPFVTEAINQYASDLRREGKLEADVAARVQEYATRLHKDLLTSVTFNGPRTIVSVADRTYEKMKDPKRTESSNTLGGQPATREHEIRTVAVGSRIDVGSFRSDGESTCTLKTGSIMVVAQLPKGMWRVVLERIG
jgi:hypothetical protein